MRTKNFLSAVLLCLLWISGWGQEIIYSENGNPIDSSEFSLPCSCASGGTLWPANTLTPTSFWQYVNSQAAGEYSKYNVMNGTVYEWSYCTEDGASISSAWDPRLNIFDDFGNWLACNGDYGCTPATAPKIAWTATFTGVVRVRTQEYFSSSVPCNSNGGLYGNLGYRSLAVPPPNDNCTSAQYLTVYGTNCGGSVSGDISNATQEYTSNLCTGCNCSSPTANEVWYVFTATSQCHTIQLTNVTFDAVTEIRNGVCAVGQNIECYDPTGQPTNINYTANVFTPGQTYYVRVFDWGSSPPPATTFDICILTPSPCITGVIEESFSSEFNIFPNPNTGIFTIETKGKEYELTVTDVVGEKILYRKITSITTEIDLSGQPKGIYFLRINDDEKKYYQKLILE